MNKFGRTFIIFPIFASPNACQCVSHPVPYHGLRMYLLAHVARHYVPVEQCGVFTPEGFVPDAERLLREKN